MSRVERRLTELGLTLPEAWRLPDGVAQKFAFVQQHNGIAYIAGHGPVDGATPLRHGKVGEALSVEDGYESARLTALAVIATLRNAAIDLDAVAWLRATVFVNATPGLDGPAITRIGDGFSDVINAAFAERGAHARATVGVAALAFDVPTIVESMVAV